MNLNIDFETKIKSGGDDSIAKTKKILKYGAGNIIEDILKSESESLGRCDYAREMYNEVENQNSSELEKIMLRAASAKIARGGNCHESAALVFAHLMKNTKEFKVQICRQKMMENDDDYHVFNRILHKEKSFIIVDEWGTNAKSYLEKQITNKNEIIIIHEQITNGNDNIFLKSQEILKRTNSYESKEWVIKDNKGVIGDLFKTNDNLTYLEEDKYIGARLKRAYNDPGLK